jgi:hypothetical protein
MNKPLVVIPYACDNPGYPGLKLSENVGSMPNHDRNDHINLHESVNDEKVKIQMKFRWKRKTSQNWE